MHEEGTLFPSEEEDQLRQIMAEMPEETTYTDKEIEELLLPNDERICNSVPSENSIPSSDLPDLDLSSARSRDKSVDKSPSDSDSESAERDKKPNVPHMFVEIERAIVQLKRVQPIASIRERFPLFLLSRPTYKISDNIRERSAAYANGLLRKTILMIDVGYCPQEKTFKVAAATDQGQLIIFEPDTTKAQLVLDCFGNNCAMTAVRWSKSLQYLAVANDLKQVRVYSFKLAIQIEESVSYKLLRTPVQLCRLSPKSLQKVISDFCFVQEIPFKLLMVDEAFEILRVDLKKHFVNVHPVITVLPLKFNTFSELVCQRVRDSSNQQATLAAVSGLNYVTIFVLEPAFEVIMVFDKEKHGRHVRKNGLANLSFVPGPELPQLVNLIVIWDKYLEVLSIEIQKTKPLKHRIEIQKRHIFSQSTLFGGALSNSLIYQLSRTGLKIFAMGQFAKEVNSQPKEEIYFRKINFAILPYGDRIEECLNNVEVAIPDLRFVKGLFAVANRRLFYSENCGLQRVGVETLSSYVGNLVQNGGNWKVGLQLLRDACVGEVQQLDEINQSQVGSKMREYSLRYINFLEAVIHDNNAVRRNESQESILWSQELLFIMDLLIDAQQIDFLLTEIVPKATRINPKLLLNLIPFIEQNRLQTLTKDALQQAIDVLPLWAIRKWVYQLNRDKNQLDLPHQLNSILKTHHCFLEIIQLNQNFGDYYTPFVLLIAAYYQEGPQISEKNGNCQTVLQRYGQLPPRTLSNGLNTQQNPKPSQSQLGKLLAYCTYSSLCHVNAKTKVNHLSGGYTSFYRSSEQTDIIECLLPLLKEQIFKILIREQAQALLKCIVPELFSGNCLRVLNEIDNRERRHDLMKDLAQSIPYQLVVEHRCQQMYWMAMLELAARRIVRLDLFVGIKCLTLEGYMEEEDMEVLVKSLWKDLEGEFRLLPASTLEEYFTQVAKTRQYLFKISIIVTQIVGGIIGRQVQVLHVMLASARHRGSNVFGYLAQIMGGLSASDYSRMKAILQENLKLFTSISPNQVCDLIYSYYPQQLPSFVQDLEEYPYEQLRLIRAVLALKGYHPDLKSLKIKYLELLIRTGQQQLVLGELMQENYPLDESMQLCRRYDVLDGLAFLLVRSGGAGETADAIRIYFRMARNQLLVLTHIELTNSRLVLEIVLKAVTRCIQICKQIDLRHHHHQNNEWFIILEQMESLKEAAYSGHGMQVAELISQQAEPEIVRAIISEVSHESIIAFLQHKMSRMDNVAVSLLILELVKVYTYDRIMTKLAQQVFVVAEIATRQTIMVRQRQGFCSDGRCDECGQLEKEIILVRYNCQHQIHPSCGQDVKDCSICSIKTESLFEKHINSKDGIKTEMYAHPVAVSKAELRHKSLAQKLADYDQMVRAE